MEVYQETPDGLPKAPRRKDTNQTVYVGESDSDGWCRWKPVPYCQEDAFLKLMETYGIEKNVDVIEYFSSYHFLGFDVKYKKYLIAVRPVEPKDEYKSLKRMINAYTNQEGQITHIVIGVEGQRANYTVVVEVKTGLVKFVDDEKGKMKKIALSLEEFIRGWELVL